MKDKMINISLVYPHQLFENNPVIRALEKGSDFVFMIEDPLFFDQYDFHNLKIELHKRSMVFYKSFLEDKGHKVILAKTIEDAVEISKLKTGDIGTIFVNEVVDNYLEKKIKKYCEKNELKLEIKETPMFLTSNTDIDSYIGLQKTHKKIYFMKNFYEWQRKRLGILIDKNGSPTGGKWSFDEDNRKKVPKGLEIPLEYRPTSAQNDSFIYATTFKEARMCLKHFLKNRLADFGPYEDAVLEGENVLFHSVLSPYLNIGLLTPEEVIKETLKFSEENDMPMNSLEGFIRQIIGWREYIRMVYIKLGSKIRNVNYFEAKKKIAYSFWTGKTGILPVDNTVQKLVSTAYSHHIPRLMIMGNFMNLCGFDPDEVYRWFMEMYIDSYDWVMVPNVYSMALYADGGMITTKPYISGSAYILKMSDFKKSKEPDDKSWDKIWDALFWNFVGKHYDKLKSEGRLGFIGVQYSKMTKERIQKHKDIADAFLKSMK
jgi:deoxyribodipyrimidine photolyase-related protein